MVARAAEDESGGAVVDAGDAPAEDAASVLFPGDNAEAESEVAAEPAAAPGDDAKPDDDAGDEDASAADTVPEDGKYTLTMPEGVEVDQEMLDALGPAFKEVGLTNAQAQSLAEKYTGVLRTRAEQMVASREAEAAAQRSGWLEQAKSDKEMGGEHWDKTQRLALSAMEKFGTPALKTLFQEKNLGNNPELIRVFWKMGEMISEDNPAGGSGGGSAPPEAAHLLFPNDTPKKG